MDEKLKKVIDLSNRLREAVAECEDVISVSIGSPILNSEDYILISNIEKHDLTGLEFHHQSKNGRWFRTGDYDIYIDGTVVGGGSQ